MTRAKKRGFGYWLLNIEAIDGHHFPLWLEPFSQNAPEYKSQAATVESAVQKVAAHTGKNCIWVLDRGFDGGSYIEILERARFDLLYSPNGTPGSFH